MPSTFCRSLGCGVGACGVYIQQHSKVAKQFGPHSRRPGIEDFEKFLYITVTLRRHWVSIHGVGTVGGRDTSREHTCTHALRDPLRCPEQLWHVTSDGRWVDTKALMGAALNNFQMWAAATRMESDNDNDDTWKRWMLLRMSRLLWKMQLSRSPGFLKSLRWQWLTRRSTMPMKWFFSLTGHSGLPRFPRWWSMSTGAGWKSASGVSGATTTGKLMQLASWCKRWNDAVHFFYCRVRLSEGCRC